MTLVELLFSACCITLIVIISIGLGILMASSEFFGVQFWEFKKTRVEALVTVSVLRSLNMSTNLGGMPRLLSNSQSAGSNQLMT